jgi:hypothetical protein
VTARLIVRTLVLAGCAAALALPVFAQARQAPAPKPDPQVQARYQLAIMADVLERAVQQGARLMSRQWQGGMPQMFLIDGGARARGFRLEGYGIFFDVDVPAMRQSVVWSWRMLDLTGGGAAGALEELRAHLKTVTDPEQRRIVDQAIRQIELQINPTGEATGSIRPEAGPRREGQARVVAVPRPQGGMPAGQTGGAQAVAEPPRPVSEPDPGDAYTVAVRDALVDAMLRYSQSLSVGADEWLVVAARDRGQPGIGSDDPYEMTTIQLRIKGADLHAFHAGRLPLEEARKRVDVKEY